MFTKLHGVTLDRLDEVTSEFTAADWAQLDDEHLDVTGLDVLRGVAHLGVDMDEDPIALYCRLYLQARDVRLGVKTSACDRSQADITAWSLAGAR